MSLGERLTFGEVHVVIHADAESTRGALGVMEEVPPHADTPLQVHTNEDELFYALEGEHVIQVGDDEHRIGPGQSAFGPRGVPHAQRRVVPGTGRILIVVTPELRDQLALTRRWPEQIIGSVEGYFSALP